MRNILQLWRQDELDVRLAALQLLSFAGTFLVIVSSALLYRHFFDDALTPVWQYLGSVKLAVPPLALLSFSYFYAFLTGASVADAPKTFWKWLRNESLQSAFAMVLYCVACLVAGGATLIFVNLIPAPVYVSLTAALLGGSNDDNTVVVDKIKMLKDKNPVFMAHLETIRQVLEERRKWNHENKSPNAALPRIFIRALDANIDDDPDWKEHPLRWFASAEAHSMLAQALNQDSTSPATQNKVATSRDIAVKLYEKVATYPRSPLVTNLMRASARQNKGNALYYSGKFKDALDTYRDLDPDEKSIPVSANAVAALVHLGKFEQAVELGISAMGSTRNTEQVLAEIRDYVSLVTNVGFAGLILERNQQAVENMQEVFDLLPDVMAKQNLALAHIANGSSAIGVEVLADDASAPIVTAQTQLDVLTRTGGGSCTYLIRGVASVASRADPVDAAANFAAYSRRAVSEGDLARDPDRWRIGAKDSLAKDTRPCGGLSFLPIVKRYLGT